MALLFYWKICSILSLSSVYMSNELCRVRLLSVISSTVTLNDEKAGVFNANWFRFKTGKGAFSSNT